MFLTEAFCLHAQELNLSTTSKGKVGYRNVAGEVVIKESFDYGEPFAPNGLAKVGKGKKFGLIDTAGNVVLPIKYDEIDAFSPKYPMRIKIGKFYGLIDSHSGKIMLEPEFESISRFNCYGLAWVKRYNSNKKSQYYNSDVGKWISLYGIIDKDFQWKITPNKFNRILELSQIKLMTSKIGNVGDTLVTDCHILGVSKATYGDSELCIIDENGNILGEGYEFLSEPVNGMMRWWKGKDYYWVKRNNSISFGYFDLDSCREIECGNFSALKKNYELIKSSVTNVGEARNKIRKCTNHTHNFWLNELGSTHGDFYGSIAPVRKVDGTDTIWCFIDRNGKEVRSGFKNVEISLGKSNENVYYVCGCGDRYRIFTSNNEELFADKVIQNFVSPNPNYGDDQDFALKISDKWGVFSRSGAVLIAPQKYDRLSSSQYGIYAAVKNGKHGYLNRKGTVLVPLAYKNSYIPVKYNQYAVWVKNDTEDLVREEVYSNYNIKEKKLSSNRYYAKSFHSYTDGTSWGVPYTGEKYNKGMTEGYLVDENDNKLITVPFPVEYVGIATQEVASNGGKPLSNSKSRSFILMITRDSKTYSIDEIIADDDWDY